MPFVTSVERIAKAEGRTEGRTEGGATVLLKQVTKLWGPLPEEVQQQIRRLPLDQLAALGEALVVPYSTQLNPPLWEAGHIGWFQDFWIARNRQRDLGSAAAPPSEVRSGPVGSIAPARTPAFDALVQ